MKDADRNISRQIKLPWRKSLEISYRNIRVRFFRSLITTGSLVLAVAFLAFVLTNVDVASGLYHSGGAAIRAVLEKAGYDVAAGGNAVVMGPKEGWIVILSLLVCAVGIVNAQLMAVTERFREIGVMKCLGALDSMVLRLFLMEAAMQGLAGSLLGALLGFLAALLTGAARFGLDAWRMLPGGEAGTSLLYAVGAGVLLSMVGVFYPAIVAARMRPIVALSAEH